MLARIRKQLEENKEQGFTLVELLVVIIIIGILAAIAVPIYLNQQAKAKDSAAQADLASMRTAVAAFIVENPDTSDPVADGFAFAGSPANTLTLEDFEPTTGAFCIQAVYEGGTLGGTISSDENGTLAEAAC